MKREVLTGFATAIAVTILVTYIFAPYYSLLNPMGGIWRGLLYAELPGKMEIGLDGLKGSVIVSRDSYGVPHIYAENEEDLFYVFGYVQAQDRLFQMDFQRRFAEGKLAEVVGEALYNTDLFFRTIGLEKAANSTFRALRSQNDDRLLRVVENFANGVNTAIEDMKAAGELPIEFKILSYEPEPWTPIDSLVIGRFIGWSLSGNFYDLEFMKAYEAFELLTEVLFPFKNPYETCIDSENFVPVDLPFEADINAIQPLIEKDEGAVKSTSGIVEWKNEVEKWILPVREAFGSNNWVVNGSLTTTGKPILCNDPHLQHMVPPVWYEAHLVISNSSGTHMNVRGVTFPGIPVIVIGHNQYLAWGVTNVGADVIDFYRYVWNSNGDQYWYLNQWENVSRIQETISVKTGTSVVKRTTYINMTRHGPVIESYDEKFAVKWIGQYPTMEARALLKFNVAKNMDEFKEGLKDFQVPAQNFVYSDIYGNIAWWANGRYPIRMNVSDASNYLEYRLPFNGSQARGEWGDWNDADAWIDPPEEVPQLVNPEAGYIATANNCPIPLEEYGHWLGWTWAENYRIRRIIDLLNEARPLSLEDMKEIQTDIYYIPAEKLVPYVINASENKQSTSELQEALEQLKNWDFVMRKDHAAPSIFVFWMENFKNDTFHDEYHRAGFEGRYPPTETVQYLVQLNSTRWFDNVETEKTETRDDIIFQSLVETVQQLKSELGSNVSEWKWGTIHHIDIEHVLGSGLSWLNYPRLQIGGWENCVNPAAGLEVSGGPSWRQIIDLSNLNNSLCIIPGGQRGHQFSRHYQDQLELWLNGEYKQMMFPTSLEEQADKESTVTFNPKS